jgi:hypothetical protein
VTHWNAVILLAPTDNAADIGQMLGTFDAADDIIIQEGTYTFSRQSVDAKKCILHGPHKLHFRTVGGVLYLMRFPKEIGLASQCLFGKRYKVAHILGGTY